MIRTVKRDRKTRAEMTSSGSGRGCLLAWCRMRESEAWNRHCDRSGAYGSWRRRCQLHSHVKRFDDSTGGVVPWDGEVIRAPPLVLSVLVNGQRSTTGLGFKPKSVNFTP